MFGAMSVFHHCDTHLYSYCDIYLCFWDVQIFVVRENSEARALRPGASAIETSESKNHPYVPVSMGLEETILNISCKYKHEEKLSMKRRREKKVMTAIANQKELGKYVIYCLAVIIFFELQKTLCNLHCSLLSSF